jgi:subtilisin-like proprotein convertase family protein
LLSLLCAAIGAPSTSLALAPQSPTDGGVSYAHLEVLPIADNSTTTSTIVVNGALPVISDVSLQTFFAHTAPADLEVTLTSPNGTVVTITTDNGGSSDNVFLGTMFDDDAPTPVTDAIYQSGVSQQALIPEEAFGAFRGEDPNGTWTLTITDDNAGETGTYAWILHIAAIAEASATAVSNVEDTTVVPLPDLIDITRTLSVSGAQGFLDRAELFVDILHTFPGDLSITLTSPQGTTVVITTGNAGSSDNVFGGTRFSDGGGTPVTDAIYTNNVAQPLLVPEGALGAFVGEDPNGTWSLRIRDTAAIDAGTLRSWSLDLRSTAQNNVPGRSASAPFSKASFTIDRTIVVDGGFGGRDQLTLAGALPVAGMLDDLSDVALTIGVNGVPLSYTLTLDAKGKFAGVRPTAKGSISPTKGTFKATLDEVRLAELLDLPNVDEEGEVRVEIEFCLVGSGMILSRATGDLVFTYKTVQDKSTKGQFSFAKNATRSAVFHVSKASAIEIVGTGTAVSANGLVSGDSAEPLVPNDTMLLAIGDQPAISIPLSAVTITGEGSKTSVKLNSGGVAELTAFTLSSQKKSFSFATIPLAGTGIPVAGETEPVVHVLPVRLTVPTAGGTLSFETLVELRRIAPTSTSWKS